VVRTLAPVNQGYTTTGTTVVGGGFTTVNSEMAKYDTEGKGWITKEQLRTACKDLAVKCDTQEDLDNIWNEIDNNGSGKVNGIEFGEFFDYVKGFREEVKQYQSQSHKGAY
jgi:Ca2+-binding EF-hand superfamily protein